MAHNEESVFDEMKESFANFVERLGDLIGFDADRYLTKDESFFSLRKANMVSVAELILSVFFIFDAIEKTSDT